MSRRENLKKSLGITEYPWSSDDDENSSAQVPSTQAPRRPSAEPRTSSADTPGTSGIQPPPASPATARKHQARMDRALFWSIINNTPRPSNTAEVRSSQRLGEVPLSCVSRPIVHVRPADVRSRREPYNPRATDIHRLLAFKRLTRSLQNYTQSKANSNSCYPTSAREINTSAGPSRSTLFTPASGSAVNLTAQAGSSSSARDNRIIDAPTRSSISRAIPSYIRNRNGNPSPVESGAGSSRSRSRPSHSPEQFVVDEDDEDVEPVHSSMSTSEDHQAPEQDENDEGIVSNIHTHNQSATLSLEEEIVEVDGPDDQEMQEDNPVPDTETETDNAAVSNNEASVVPAAVHAPENAVEVQPPTSPYQGVKRKRDAAGENAEPYSVQEFNQTLLRLLECPVCLEWMEPPISQCRRGHLVCSRCRARLASCPVCRTTFSSVRNRAMEGVAEMLRYPCRHGCGREVRLRRRAPHEASCPARRYHCPAPACARLPALPHHELHQHVQSKHLPILKIGRKHKFSMKVNSEQHDTWIIMALDEFFHLRVDVDIRTWGVVVYVAYIGPKRKSKHFTYEVTVEGQHNARKLVYARTTHSDLESSSLNVSRQDCFHLTLDQALNFLRFKNRHCEPDKFLDFDVEITKWDTVVDESKDESDS